MSRRAVSGAVGSLAVDPDAPADYTAFFRLHYEQVLRSLYLVVGDVASAEELAQDAFIQLLRNWSKVSRYDRPEAWVRRVGIRLAVRHVRRERLRSLLERKSEAERLRRGPAPDLEVPLRALTPAQRTALTFHYYEGLPVTEIADLMGCSSNTVKSHLRRGRERLRAMLSDATEGRP